MKYQASLPEHNDNISHEHPLKDFLLILAALSVLVVAGIWVLGFMVDAVVDRLSPETEKRLTGLLAMSVPAPVKALQPREAYIQSLVDSLRSCAGVDTPVTVRLTSSKDANAVVMPGGTVLVFSGLLEHAESENGLAFVLAHELAHLANRDHLRGMGRGIVIITVATLVTGDGSWTAGLLAPAQQLGESSYSRGRESAADALALKALQCRYGHVGGATELFASLNKDDDMPAIAHYLASHPSMGARIAAIELAIRRAGLRKGEVRALPKP